MLEAWMRRLAWPLGLLLTGCGQGEYRFTTHNDVASPIIDSVTDSGPIVWEDCGIEGAAGSVVQIDHTCVSASELAVDLKLSITDACFPSCEEGAPVFIAVQITNQGGVDVSGNIPLAINAGAAAAGSGDVPLLTASHSGGLAAGTMAEGMVLEFDVNALEGLPIRAEVNDDGTGNWTVAECDLDNNRATWDAVPCGSD